MIDYIILEAFLLDWEAYMNAMPFKEWKEIITKKEEGYVKTHASKTHKGIRYHVKIDRDNNKAGVIRFYLNLPKYLKGENHSDFTLNDLHKAIYKLVAFIRIPPQKLRVTTVEFGLNFLLPPSISVIDWVFSLWLFNRKVANAGKNKQGFAYQEVRLYRYTLKFYDKGKQNNLEQELGRFEIKAKNAFLKQKNKYNGWHIHTLYDLLDERNLKKLFEEILSAYSLILKVEPIDEAALSKADKVMYEKCTKKNHFERLIAKKAKRYDDHRKRLLGIIDVYKIGNIHQEVVEAMSLKWQELMDEKPIYLNSLNEPKAKTADYFIPLNDSGGMSKTDDL